MSAMVMLRQQSLDFRPPRIWKDFRDLLIRWLIWLQRVMHCFLSCCSWCCHLPQLRRNPRSSRFEVERSLFRERYTGRKEKDHFLRSFTTMGVLLACSANRHSKHSGPCLQGTDGCSSDPTGEAKALVLRQVRISVMS